MGDVREELQKIIRTMQMRVRTARDFGGPISHEVVQSYIDELSALSARAAVPEGWVIERVDDGQLRVFGPPGSPGGMYPRPDAGPLSERLLHALAAALLAAAPQPAGEVPKCARCSSSTAAACDDIGCGFLSSGNGAPGTASEYARGRSDGWDAAILKCKQAAAAAVKDCLTTADVEALAEAIYKTANQFDAHRKGLPSEWEDWADEVSRELRGHVAAVRRLSSAQQVEARIVGWMHEDELPEGYPYDAMFPHSRVDGVRLFPVYAPAQQAGDGNGVDHA